MEASALLKEINKEIDAISEAQQDDLYEIAVLLATQRDKNRIIDMVGDDTVVDIIRKLVPVSAKPFIDIYQIINPSRMSYFLFFIAS